MTVLIDADGCPVVDITVNICRLAGVECIIICDTAHVFNKVGAKTVVVSQGNDSVDFKLVNIIEKGDIVVTQDYGLAAMCLSRGAVPLNQNGMIYSDDNIDGLLMQRHISKKIRMAGGCTKCLSKRTSEQNKSFEKTLRYLLHI